MAQCKPFWTQTGARIYGVSLLTAGGCTTWPIEVPFNPTHSMILWSPLHLFLVTNWWGNRNSKLKSLACKLQRDFTWRFIQILTVWVTESLQKPRFLSLFPASSAGNILSPRSAGTQGKSGSFQCNWFLITWEEGIASYKYSDKTLTSFWSLSDLSQPSFGKHLYLALFWKGVLYNTLH